ncbi:MAG: hypothetical protein A2Y10_03680 [Planctomycetes bacterium GWF2_41_51]|nr:MAG: hypothetical protein A2Y10_03680 [Planctomycetes bacterium GWF2_41_51]HBG28844.1 hypothetical protein [Phycisphaerales bacterium]
MSKLKDSMNSTISEQMPVPNRGSVTSFFSSPWIYIPAIYLLSGTIEGGPLQYGTAIMYKDMGYANSFIGYLSLLNIPILLSFLWAPYVDSWASKRKLSILFLFLTGFITALIAVTIHFSIFFTLTSLTAFLLLAVVYSFFKIAADGYYIRILDPKQQAAFIGIKTSAIRVGIICAIAILIRMAGQINVSAESKTAGWVWMYIILSILLFVGAVYNFFFLPKTVNDKAVKNPQGFALFAVLKEYLKQNKAVLLIIYILLCRLGEGVLVKMADPFFMDPFEKGGLNMDIPSLTLVKSFAGFPCTIIGGIAGGWIIKKFGLKKTFLTLACCMSVPNLGYWYLAKTLPTAEIIILGQSLNRDMFSVVCIESLGYGIGFSAFFYYLHAMATGLNKTSLFAISSALMGFGFYIPCAVSGLLQEAIGYPMLFLCSFLLAVPGIAMVKFLPMTVNNTEL